MERLAAVIFVVTYLGLAAGRIPGLALDRTGIALLGAIAMVVAGVLGVPEAVAAIDVPTILLLYGLMVLSAQLRLGGFYTWAAMRMTAFLGRPRLFLLACMGTAAALSAVLANDIVCLAFTPVLALSLRAAGRRPVPFLVGLAVASNIGSAATIIGNPQNMLIGQVGGLDFARFLAYCGPPSLAALAGSYLLILRLARRDIAVREATGEEEIGGDGWPRIDEWQTAKGLVMVLLLVGFFFTAVPRELSCLAAAGVLLCSRRLHSRRILGLVDWHLITLFVGLFVVVAGIEAAGVPARALEALAGRGIDLGRPAAIAAVAAVLSNLVSNVPATMLLVRFLPAGDPAPWYALALATTFAGNLILLGSIANLIVVEQAASLGLRISFREHARLGVPVTLLSFVLLAAWIALAA